MNILGIACGAGIPLFAAKKLGFDVIGNIEWRKDFSHRSYYLNNLGIFSRTINAKKFAKEFPIDVIVGHPKCSSFSTMPSSKSKINKLKDREEHIPKFIKYVKELQPKIFFMDNLIKSFDTYNAKWYIKQLKNYNINFTFKDHRHWICAKKRLRILLWGIRKDSKLEFAFAGRVKYLYDEPPLFDEVCQLPDRRDIKALDHIHYKYHKFPLGYCPAGEKGPFGRERIPPNSPAKSLTQSGETSMHPRTGYPLTIAERRLITGLPNDFKMTGSIAAKGVALAATIPYPFIYEVLKSFKEQNEGRIK